MANDLESNVRQAHRFRRIAEDGFPALGQDELAESPNVEILVALHLPDLLRIRPVCQTLP